jgi:hypothetical protein
MLPNESSTFAFTSLLAEAQTEGQAESITFLLCLVCELLRQRPDTAR